MLLHFVPRQVQLLKPHAAMATTTTIQEDHELNKRKEKKQHRKKSSSSETLVSETQRGVLISVAAFLERIGFARSLAAVQSEASLEVNDWKSSSVNLEDLYCKFLDGSKGPEEASVVSKKEQDTNKASVSEGNVAGSIGVTEHDHKKKREKSSAVDNGTENDMLELATANKSGEDGYTTKGDVADATEEKKTKKKSSVAAENAETNHQVSSMNEVARSADQKVPENEKNKDAGQELQLSKVEDGKKKSKKHKTEVGSSNDVNQQDASTIFEEVVVHEIDKPDSVDHELQLSKVHEHEKKKKSKKKKADIGSSNEVEQPNACTILEGVVKDKIAELKSLVDDHSKLVPKHKDDKKKRIKTTENAEKSDVCKDLAEKKSQAVKPDESVLGDIVSEDKEKKRKKAKSNSENQSTGASEKVAGIQADEDRNTSVAVKANSAVLDKENEGNEVKVSKRNKKSASEVTLMQADNKAQEKDADAKSEGADDKVKNVPEDDKNDEGNEKKVSKRKRKSASGNNVMEAENEAQGKDADAKSEGTDNKVKNVLEADKNDVGKEKKVSKRKKKSTSDSNFMQAQGKDAGAKSEGAENSKPENVVAGKKRKLEESIGNGLSSVENPGSDDDQTMKNGHGENDVEEGSNVSKASKRQKLSSEQKTSANAFRRVKVEEVKFFDERLKDNSYWAKGGADTGYGAKAEEVLGQVRGRDFRHEKTKKKRGTYRGGQIDTQSHSVKFNYSDEE